VQEVRLHVPSLTGRNVKEHLAGESRLIKSQRRDARGCAGETRPRQSLLALCQIQIDHRWVDEKHTARSAECSYQIPHLILCQIGHGSLAARTVQPIERSARISDPEWRFTIKPQD